MSALIANPPPIPTRPLRTGPNVRDAAQLTEASILANGAVSKFADVEQAMAACLRHATETLGYRCTVSDAAAYDVRRTFIHWLHTLQLETVPDMPLSAIRHALEWTGGDDDPANEAEDESSPQPQRDESDACPAETAAAATSDLQPTVSSLQPDLIVASVNDERDEILAALGLELVTVLPSSNHGRFKLVVKSTAEGPPVGPIPMLYPEVVTVEDVRGKIVCGEIPLRLAMHASLNINLESGPPGEPPHLAAYRVHRAATNGGDR